MPKNNKIIKENGRTRKVKVSRKLRVGSRKSGVSAHSLSNEQLLQSLLNRDLIKQHPHINKVLQLRG